MLASRSANPVDQATVACLRIDVYTMLGRCDRAVDVCLAYLHQRGIDWSPHPTRRNATRYERTWSLLGPREIEELVDLPLMREPESVATLDVLTGGLTAAVFTDAHLMSLIICRMVVGLEHGNTDASCHAYVCSAQLPDRVFVSTRLVFGSASSVTTSSNGADGEIPGSHLFILRRSHHAVDETSPNLPRFDPSHLRYGECRRRFTYAAYSCDNLIANLLATVNRSATSNAGPSEAWSLPKRLLRPRDRHHHHAASAYPHAPRHDGDARLLL